MRKKRRIWKILLLVIVLSCGVCVPVSAGYEDQMYLIAGFKDETLSTRSPAIPYHDTSGKYIIADLSLGDGNPDEYIMVNLTDEETFGFAKPEGMIEEYSLMQLSLQSEYEQDFRYFELGCPIQGQIVDMVYWDWENSCCSSCSLRLTEFQDGKIPSLKAELVDGAQNEEAFSYPAALINEDGELVGIAASKGIMATLGDEETFYGSPEESESPKETEIPEETKNPEATEIPEATENPDKGDSEGKVRPDSTDNTSSGGLLRDILYGVAVSGAAALVVCIFKKKKTKKGVPGSAAGSEDIGPTAPRPMAPESIAPGSGAQMEDNLKTRAFEGTQLSGITVVGIGGIMAGRTFSTDGPEMTFGRDPSAVVSFPADTKGVSREHCRLFRDNGRLILTDSGSSYGTYVRGRGRMASDIQAEMKKGDVFYLGEEKNSFMIQ